MTGLIQPANKKEDAMNAPRQSLIVSVGVVALLAAGGGLAQAQVYDHLECYKIKDPLKLKAVVDLNSPQFGLAPNCEVVGKAKFFCAPAKKTVGSAFDKGTRPPIPITPLPFTGPNAGSKTGPDHPVDRICYKVKCKVPPPTPATPVTVTDQFGTRTLTEFKFKTHILCTPAVKGVPPAGWLGKIELATYTFGYDGAQYWYDSDGVAPLVAGCHYPFRDVTLVDTPDSCNTGIALAAGTFGELCVAHEVEDVFKRVALVPVATGLYLIETNPGQNVCHSHKKGVGHPDVYDCDRFCKAQVGFTWGQCEQVPNTCNGLPSARCKCEMGNTPTATHTLTPTGTPTQTPTNTP